MLIVKGTQAASAGQLYLGDLVTMLEWPIPATSRDEPPLYWRTGDFSHSLLEIGVHRQTGRLLSITVVAIASIGPLEAHERAFDEAPTLIADQVPLFDLALWSEDRPLVDEPSDLRVRIGNNRLTIEWGVSTAGNYTIQSGRCFMGVDEHYALIGLHVNPISDAEITTIQKMFSR